MNFYPGSALWNGFREFIYGSRSKEDANMLYLQHLHGHRTSVWTQRATISDIRAFQSRRWYDIDAL